MGLVSPLHFCQYRYIFILYLFLYMEYPIIKDIDLNIGYSLLDIGYSLEC